MEDGKMTPRKARNTLRTSISAFDLSAQPRRVARIRESCANLKSSECYLGVAE